MNQKSSGMEWIRTRSCETLVIGSGCAAFNAADTLYDLGCRDILLVTEGLNMGTSRNTGSDKQTYYKLSVQSGEADCVEKMTAALIAGKSVNGDTAFVEAVNSIRSFMKLVNLGVPFPTNEYGEFIGYQTDHTTEKRATSVGPLTSKYMTEALERQVKRKNIEILDRVMIVELLQDDAGIIGALGVDLETNTLIEFQCPNIILATGGPAAIYQNRVYPPSQTGMSGMAIEAGAVCANLQEWQYGIASVDFRWNLSGTYQQVLPRYISVEADGTVHELIEEYFANPMERYSLVFLKGYQWPFDSRKLNGSSVIDLIVYREEMLLGRAVYLDYRTEPLALKDGLDGLSKEAYSYLASSDALLDTPIGRLKKMNPLAIELYRSHGIDLYKEPLRITVAAQHNNGGIAVDVNWQSNIPGLYAAGEVAGNFGVYRPGGSALNACQVGSLRAAEHIRQNRRGCSNQGSSPFSRYRDFYLNLSDMGASSAGSRLVDLEQRFAAAMSTYGAHIRDRIQLQELDQEIVAALSELEALLPELCKASFPRWCKLRDMLLTQRAVAASMVFAAMEIGSRGGAIYRDASLTCTTAAELMSLSIFSTDVHDTDILYYQITDGCFFREARTVPQTEKWFETVWNKYNQRMNTETEGET